MVDPKRVRQVVLATAVHTFVGCLFTLLVMGLVIALVSRYVGPRVMLGIFISSFIGCVVMFAISELVVITLYRASAPDPEKHRAFITGIDRLCDKIGIWFRPRLYILKMPGNVPNACAFGLGFLGQCGVGITQELYDMMSQEELEGVLAHELAHIRCKDVGLMTLLTLITNGAASFAELMISGKSMLAKTPLAFLVGYLLKFISKFVFPIGRNAISQQREFAADALGSKYVGSTKPLKSALKKLADAFALRTPDHDDGPLSDLFITHPRMERRLEALDALEV